MRRSYKDATSEERPALFAIASELDRTTVISDEFKAFIWSWATQASREAHERGEKAGYARGFKAAGGVDIDSKVTS